MLVCGLDDCLNERELFVRGHPCDAPETEFAPLCSRLNVAVSVTADLEIHQPLMCSGAQMGSAHQMDEVQRVEAPVERVEGRGGSLP